MSSGLVSPNGFSFPFGQSCQHVHCWLQEKSQRGLWRRGKTSSSRTCPSLSRPSWVRFGAFVSSCSVKGFLFLFVFWTSPIHRLLHHLLLIKAARPSPSSWRGSEEEFKYLFSLAQRMPSVVRSMPCCLRFSCSWMKSKCCFHRSCCRFHWLPAAANPTSECHPAGRPAVTSCTNQQRPCHNIRERIVRRGSRERNFHFEFQTAKKNTTRNEQQPVKTRKRNPREKRNS